jgi:hypothetical protein
MADAADNTLDAVAAAIRGPAPKAAAPEPAPAAEPEDNSDLVDDDVNLAEQPEEQAEEPAPEGEEQPEEETEEQPEEEIDIDEIPIEVTIDGETKEIPLKELKANYSGEKAIERRLQEATEVRQQVYSQGQTLYQALGAMGQKLQHLDSILAETAQPEVDWDTLRATDPARYLLERDKFQIAEQKRQAIWGQQQQVQQEQQYLQQQYLIEVAKDQANKLLKDMPELRDPQKGPEKMKGMVDTAAKYGFSFDEVRQVMDSRQLKVLARLAELEAKSTKPATMAQPKAPRPLSKPGSTPSSAPMTEMKKMQLAALKRARVSGKVDDVASLLLVRKK